MIDINAKLKEINEAGDTNHKAKVSALCLLLLAELDDQTPVPDNMLDGLSDDFKRLMVQSLCAMVVMGCNGGI